CEQKLALKAAIRFRRRIFCAKPRDMPVSCCDALLAVASSRSEASLDRWVVAETAAASERRVVPVDSHAAARGCRARVRGWCERVETVKASGRLPGSDSIRLLIARCRPNIAGSRTRTERLGECGRSDSDRRRGDDRGEL